MQPSASRWQEAAGRMPTTRKSWCLLPTGCRYWADWWVQPGPGGSPHLKAAVRAPPASPSLPQAEETHKCASCSWLVGGSSPRETLWMGVYSTSQELQMFRGGQRNPQAVTAVKTPQLWAECYYDF